MPPKLRQWQTVPVPRECTTQRKNIRIQTSGLLKLPLELFFEIFSYLSDHRSFIRENYYGREMHTRIERKHAERQLVIGRLTMTCWPLRNGLLPLLWTDAEGCISHIPYNWKTNRGGVGYHLYAQCAYLSSNRAVAAHVRTFSVTLSFYNAPEDLMTRFVDCLVRLPNLKTLEILGAGPRAPISKALSRKYAVFPRIRELRITPACHHFIRKCPNLKNLTFTGTMDIHAPSTLESYGKELERVAGVTIYCWRGIYAVSRGCPDLREIGIVGSIVSDKTIIQRLRQLKHLSIIDVNLDRRKDILVADWEKMRAAWRRELMSILRDSPSTERKFMKWKIIQHIPYTPGSNLAYEVVESEELEVS